MSLFQFYNSLKSNDLNVLNVDLNNPVISFVQPELASLNNSQLVQQVQELKLFGGDYSSFENLVVSFLKLCRDVDSKSVLKSHDLYLVYLNDLSVAFMNPQGSILTELIYGTLRYLVPLMIKLDKVLNALKGKKYKRLIFISTVLSKLFNHLRSSKSEEKKSIILFIVNQLNKVYFIIGSPLLCANIFANTNNINGLKLSSYPKPQQLEFRFILGRFYLIKNQLFKSFVNLNWCYMHSSINDDTNKLKILRYLIPIGLLLERYPNESILMKYNELFQLYKPLIHSLRTGDHFNLQLHLYHNQEYFKAKSLLILLSTRSRILIFKNLLKRTLIILQRDSYRLNYDELAIILNKSINIPQQSIFNDSLLFQIPVNSISTEFIENISTSIIQNSLMKGNILSRAKLLVLSKKDPFPNTFEVYKTSFDTGANEGWMDL